MGAANLCSPRPAKLNVGTKVNQAYEAALKEGRGEEGAAEALYDRTRYLIRETFQLSGSRKQLFPAAYALPERHGVATPSNREVKWGSRHHRNAPLLSTGSEVVPPHGLQDWTGLLPTFWFTDSKRLGNFRQ